MLPGEDEEAFLKRRLEDERQKMAETSCVVRGVHDELADLYEDRLAEAEAETRALEALTARID